MKNIIESWKSLNEQYERSKTDLEYHEFIKKNKKDIIKLYEVTYPNLLSMNDKVITDRGGNGDYTQNIQNPSRTGPIDLVSQQPKLGLYVFSVPGDDWPNSKDQYQVDIKFNKTGANSLKELDVQVKCDCPFFIYNGPEYNAKSNGYLYQEPYGTASEPNIRDPERVYYICKHIASVFSLINKKFRFPPSWYKP